MKRKISALIDELSGGSHLDKRKLLDDLIVYGKELRKEERGNELLWKHMKPDMSNEIMSYLTIKDLVYASIVCKKWYKYILAFMRRECRSNIPVSISVPLVKDYLFQFLGVGGNAWIPTPDGPYTIANTRATFSVCALKPRVQIFYFLWGPTVPTPAPRQIHLKQYEEVLVDLKTMVSGWRMTDFTKRQVQLIIAAQYLNVRQRVSIPVIVPNANIGFKRMQKARKNNILII